MQKMFFFCLLCLILISCASSNSMLKNFPFLTRIGYEEQTSGNRILKWRVYDYNLGHNESVRFWHLVVTAGEDSLGNSICSISERPWKVELYRMGILKYRSMDDDFDGEPEQVEEF